jgi:2-C-methyl-D-erythritol 4-phosphate cytidylyltransferase
VLPPLLLLPLMQLYCHQLLLLSEVLCASHGHVDCIEGGSSRTDSMLLLLIPLTSQAQQCALEARQCRPLLLLQLLLLLLLPLLLLCA